MRLVSNPYELKFICWTPKFDKNCIKSLNIISMRSNLNLIKMSHIFVEHNFDKFEVFHGFMDVFQNSYES